MRPVAGLLWVRALLQVSDGKHSRYTVLNVNVTALTLSVWNVSASTLVQGELSTTVAGIHVVSSGSPRRIIYNVTRPPRHGRLYRDDEPVLRFR